jgi:antitoxin (DNA-binding transcriptional repressor) of toxin-antitoxin stability system
MLRADIQSSNLIDLIEQVKAGNWVSLEDHGTVVAKIVPPSVNNEMISNSNENTVLLEERKPGIMKGKIHLKDNFDDPLPDEIAQAFGMVK